MRNWRRNGVLGIVAVLAATALTGCSDSSDGIEINFYNSPQQNISAIVDRCNDLAGDRYRIKLNTLPRDADSQREQFVRRLAAEDSGLDILGIDIMWTAELAAAGWIREWTGEVRDKAEAGTLQAPLTTGMWDDKLYAAPYTSNVQLLWYRTDLVPTPPTTWDEMITMATQLKAENKPHYVEVTGAQYEGLVVWFNSLVAAAGGSILNSAGTKVDLGPPAERALETMRTFARSAAADPSMANMHEDQVRLAMESGSAAMEINWPFVYPSMVANKPDIARNFAWAPYPGIDGPGRAPLGGANFAISRYSKHPKEAFDAALCLRDPESQQIAATRDGLPPTIEAVYATPAMAEAYPMRDTILEAVKSASTRPVTPTYQNVSTVTSATLSPPRSIDPPSTLRRLRSQISDALDSKGVLP